MTVDKEDELLTRAKSDRDIFSLSVKNVIEQHYNNGRLVVIQKNGHLTKVLKGMLSTKKILEKLLEAENNPKMGLLPTEMSIQYSQHCERNAPELAEITFTLSTDDFEFLKELFNLVAEREG